jgi:uroporphyrin-III C-methyltransferase / precorrin-2 dehydrogenase / sirohydrochlorin ferrochelatase
VDYFPVFMDLRGRRCLVVGGTEAAARKVSLLLDAGAHVTLVAPAQHESFTLLPTATLQYVARSFISADLVGVVLVIAACAEREQNRMVARAAEALGLPVNVVDDPALCSVIVPAIVDRSPLLIAIGTGGSSPVLARIWRGRIEAQVPMRLRELAALCAAMRAEVRAALPGVPARRRFWEDVLSGEVAELALQGKGARAETALRSRLTQVTSGVGSRRGVVYLIGAGPNDPELLSLRALRCLQSADWVFTVPEVPSSIVDLARRDAVRSHFPEWPAIDVASTIRHFDELVGQGQSVCLLAPCDAFRQEPGRALQRRLELAGLSCVVVPGIA